MGSINSATNASVGGVKPTRVRFWIVVMLFAVTAINYGDRATLSIAGAPMSSALGLDAIGMGYVFLRSRGLTYWVSCRAAGC